MDAPKARSHSPSRRRPSYEIRVRLAKLRALVAENSGATDGERQTAQSMIDRLTRRDTDK